MFTLLFYFEIGKNKTNKNLPHGVSSQSGVESTVVGEENNLNTLESSLETEEVSKWCLLYSCIHFVLNKNTCR